MSECWGICGGALALGLGLMLPVQAVDIQHMQQRLDHTINQPEQRVSQTAEAIICKHDKKPVCYANGVVKEGHFMLVRVHRPEARDFYMLFYQDESQWKPIYSRPMTQLDAAQWKRDKVAIPEQFAHQLIKQLLAL